MAVIGAADGTVPSPNATTPIQVDAAATQDLQRERWLLFVACSRARGHLCMSCCRYGDNLILAAVAIAAFGIPKCGLLTTLLLDLSLKSIQ